MIPWQQTKQNKWCCSKCNIYCEKSKISNSLYNKGWYLLLNYFLYFNKSCKVIMQQVFSFLPILNLKLPRKFPDIYKDFIEEKKKKNFTWFEILFSQPKKESCFNRGNFHFVSCHLKYLEQTCWSMQFVI